MKRVEKYLNCLLEKAKEVFTRDDITPDTRFKEDLGAKSINIAQLMNVLEDEYDFEIPYMDFKRCTTIAEAAEFVKSLDEE